jgi:hypothetical protein
MTFQKLDLFLSSDVGGRTPTQLGPLDRANLNHWFIDVNDTEPKLLNQLELNSVS